MPSLTFRPTPGTQVNVQTADRLVRVRTEQQLEVRRVDSFRTVVTPIGAVGVGGIRSAELTLPPKVLGSENEEEVIVYFWAEVGEFAIKVARFIADQVAPTPTPPPQGGTGTPPTPPAPPTGTVGGDININITINGAGSPPA